MIFINDIISNQNKRWSNDDIKYLKNNYSNKTTYELQEHLGRNLESIKNMARKYKLTKNKETISLTYSMSRTNLNHNYFKNWTPNMAYIVGFIYADGCLHDRKYDKGYSLSIKLQEQDEYILRQMLDELESDRQITYGGINRKEIRINSKVIYDDLTKIGIEPNKTYGMNFPNTIPSEMLSHFIRGFCDGDGSIKQMKSKSKNGKIYNYPVVKFVGPPDFMDGLQKIITKEVGLKEKKLYKCHSSDIIKGIQYTGKEATELMNWMYKDSDMKLLRKYDRYLSYTGAERSVY